MSKKIPTTPEDILTASDPEVIAAKKFVEDMDAKGDFSNPYNMEKYYAAKRRVTEDMLSRCVFEMDGQRYQITIPSMIINGKRFTAPEVLQDQRILRYLVNQKGSVIPIS